VSAPRIAVFASGGGRSVENLAERIERGELAAEIALVVTDRAGIGVLDRAARLGLETLVLPWRECADAADFGERAFAAVDERGCVLVVLAGFLRLLHVPPRWDGRVINIHPALLPDFGGPGYYGDRVHAAVLAAGRDESGCTVHLVDERYDHGKVLLQRRVPVLAGDTVDDLAGRVFEAEKEALPEAVERMLSGEFRGLSGVPGESG
jgi:phosphoribosylglycinamide formyltransferase-1